MNCNKCKDKNYLIECGCGCGNVLFKRDKFYETRKFIFGHHMKVRDQKGEKNTNYKGYRHKHKTHGYWFVRKPDHPYQQNGYVTAHRLVMEQYLHIMTDEEYFIPPNYDIHHINGNKEDNSLMNLELVRDGFHTELHNKKDFTGRRCSNSLCKTPTETYIRKHNNSPNWFNDGNSGWLCSRCNYRKYYKKMNK